MSFATSPQLRRLFRIVNGGTPKVDESNWGGPIPWATPIDIGQVDGGTLLGTERTLTDVGLRTGSRSVPAGSLIVSIRAPVGYVAAVHERTAFNQGCKGLVPVADLDLRFHQYQLVSLKDRLSSESQGSTFTELSGERLAQIPLISPPIEEQRRIADHLDAETARIDALIAKRQRQIELLEERFDALIDVIIEPTRGPWDRLSRSSGGLTVGVVVNPSTYVADTGDVPFFRGVDVRRFQLSVDGAQRITRANASLLKKSALHPGDVVAVRVGDPGVSAVVPEGIELANCASLLIIRRSARTLSAFLVYLLNGPWGRGRFRALANGAAQLQVNVSDAVGMPVPVRSTTEQAEIVRVLDEERARVASVKGALKRQIGLLRERRQALITAMVTGVAATP